MAVNEDSGVRLYDLGYTIKSSIKEALVSLLVMFGVEISLPYRTFVKREEIMD